MAESQVFLNVSRTPGARIHLSSSEKPKGIRHFWSGVMLEIVPKSSPKIVPKRQQLILKSARVELAPVGGAS
jgi:hypothetical protein